MLARSTAQVHCQAGISGSCCLALCLAILLEAILGSVLMLRGDKDLAQMFRGTRGRRPRRFRVPVVARRTFLTKIAFFPQSRLGPVLGSLETRDSL